MLMAEGGGGRRNRPVEGERSIPRIRLKKRGAKNCSQMGGTRQKKRGEATGGEFEEPVDKKSGI